MKRTIIALFLALVCNPTLLAAELPPAPENFQYGWLYSEVLLTWNEVPDALGYNVYRFDDASTNWVQIAAGVTVPRYRDPNNIPATYTLTAVNAAGEGSAAPPVLAQEGTPGGATCTLPDPAVYDTVAVFEFTVSIMDGQDGMLEAGPDPTSLTHFVWNTNYAPYQRLTLTNLLPGTYYYCRITTVGTGRSGSSVWRTFWTRPAGQGLEVQNQNYLIWEDYGPFNVSAVAWDPSYYGPSLPTVIVGDPSLGTVVSNGFQSFLYTPNTNAFGTDVIYFAATNSLGISSVGTITIQINAVDDPPEPLDMTVNARQNRETAIVPQIHDVEGDSVSWAECVTYPTNGNVTWMDGAFRYYPLFNASGDDMFTYNVWDSGGACSTRPATVLIDILPNHPPAASNLTATTFQNTQVTIAPQAYDPDGDPIVDAQITSPPSNGGVGLYNGSFIYMPNPGFTGYDVFTYRVCDYYYLCSDQSATVRVHVRGENQAPVATNLSIYAHLGSTYYGSFPVWDPEGDTLTCELLNTPLGIVTINGTNFTYTPYNISIGPRDTLWYRVSDGQYTSSDAYVDIRIGGTNHPPLASSQSVWVVQNHQLGWPLNVHDDPNDQDTVLLTSPPTNGTLRFVGTYAIYLPATNYVGLDSFSYKLFDGSATGNVAKVTLNVIPNRPPFAISQTITLPEDWSVGFDLTGSDPDGDPLSFVILSNPTHGRLCFTNPSWMYSPNANFNGTDSFTFTANDGLTNGNVATVTFVVTAVNDAPWASNQTVTVIEDTPTSITPNAGDIDGDPLTFSILTPPMHGTAIVNGGTILYTPATNYFGSDSLQYEVRDPINDWSRATITIDVQNVNDPPGANSMNVTTPEDRPAAITLTGTDADGDSLSFEIVGYPAHGTLTGSGGNLVYTPAANFNGSDSFTFKANDGQVYGNLATVSITVSSLNDAPVLERQDVFIDEDTGVNITLTALDVDNDNLSFTVVTPPVSGVVTGTPPVLYYMPNTNYWGEDGLDYAVFDGTLWVTGHVAIHILGVQDAPVAINQFVTTAEDTPMSIILQGLDVDRDQLIYTVITAPAHGTLTESGANRVYTPEANYSGPDSFAFNVSDGRANSGLATVGIMVTPVNDAPVVDPVSASTAYNTPVSMILSGSDIEGSPLTYRVLDAPTNGTVTVSGATLTYAPIGATGIVTFTCLVNDGELDSAPATVTVTVGAPSGKPANPSSLSATAVSSSQINITWKDNATNEDGYKIERSTDNKTWTQIDIVSPNVKTYSSTGLLPNKTYYFRVRAWNVLGYSNYSNTKSVKTLL